jgi:tripartite-type tricarboxylate transporter receptor subunit TctC
MPCDASAGRAIVSPLARANGVLRRFKTAPQEGIMKRLFTSFLCVAGCAALAAPVAVLAQAYPAKTVRVIVPHPPGGPGDVPPRGLAQMLSQSLRQPFVVENREGADGIIGAEACAKAPADGYTVCSMSNGVVLVNPIIRTNMPYDTARFAPVVQIGTLYSLMLAIPSLPASSMSELLALAKAKPDSVSVGTYGSINLASLFVQWTKAQLGVSFYPIPYKSASQGLQAALAGDVQLVSFALGQGSKLVQAGKLKALAVNAQRRLESMPNVPTLRESGVEVDYRSWFGWYMPAGAPREVVFRLNGEVSKLIADPQFNAKFIASQGLASDWPTGASPEDFEKFIRTEREDFLRLAKVAGIKPQ